MIDRSKNTKRWSCLILSRDSFLFQSLVFFSFWLSQTSHIKVAYCRNKMGYQRAQREVEVKTEMVKGLTSISSHKTAWIISPLSHPPLQMDPISLPDLPFCPWFSPIKRWCELNSILLLFDLRHEFTGIILVGFLRHFISSNLISMLHCCLKWNP